MKLNNLTKNNKKKIRVGRGIGSGKGKTSGRGVKGQKSRSGVAIKSFEGGQMPLYRRLPKRGFKSLNKKNTAILNLAKIQSIIEKNKNEIKNNLDLKILKEKKLVNKKFLKLKILGTGEVKKNIEIAAHYASKQALSKIEKAGGKINILKKVKIMSSETLNTAGAFSQAKDLKNRIIFTILILIIYRLGTYVPLAGIDPTALKEIMASSQKGLLGMFNMFSGGAVTRMAIFALGIMPYISASIIVQLLTGVSDYFKNLKEQGEIGRKKITQITRYGTVLIAGLQGYGVSVGLENAGNLVIEPGMSFKIITTISLVAGTTFLMWLGEQITLRGVGNGDFTNYFSGIVAEIPRALASTFELGRTGALSAVMIVGIFVLVILTVLFIVFFERAMRKILINYPKRQVGNKMYGGRVISFTAKN